MPVLKVKRNNYHVNNKNNINIFVSIIASMCMSIK